MVTNIQTLCLIFFWIPTEEFCWSVDLALSGVLLMLLKWTLFFKGFRGALLIILLLSMLSNASSLQLIFLFLDWLSWWRKPKFGLKSEWVSEIDWIFWWEVCKSIWLLGLAKNESSVIDSRCVLWGIVTCSQFAASWLSISPLLMLLDCKLWLVVSISEGRDWLKENLGLLNTSLLKSCPLSERDFSIVWSNAEQKDFSDVSWGFKTSLSLRTGGTSWNCWVAEL